MSHREKAREICAMMDHDWVQEYYGYRCAVCGDFIPYGCEPWIDVDLDDLLEEVD
jgi:hypothetical protein